MLTLNELAKMIGGKIQDKENNMHHANVKQIRPENMPYAPNRVSFYVKAL